MRNVQALAVFLARKDEFDALLERLAAASEDHFDLGVPDEINWGHVGTLTEWTAQLRRISHAVFGEGEHADKP